MRTITYEWFSNTNEQWMEVAWDRFPYGAIKLNFDKTSKVNLGMLLVLQKLEINLKIELVPI